MKSDKRRTDLEKEYLTEFLKAKDIYVDHDAYHNFVNSRYAKEANESPLRKSHSPVQVYQHESHADQKSAHSRKHRRYNNSRISQGTSEMRSYHQDDKVVVGDNSPILERRFEKRSHSRSQDRQNAHNHTVYQMEKDKVPETKGTRESMNNLETSRFNEVDHSPDDIGPRGRRNLTHLLEQANRMRIAAHKTRQMSPLR